MSIKPDSWIKRMATGHGMIEPFEAGQVRANGNGKMVSYGTSSYGYDVRCAPEFKVFTNIYSATVHGRHTRRFERIVFGIGKLRCKMRPPAETI